MPLLSPKFNSIGQSKTNKKRQEQKQQFEADYNAIKHEWDSKESFGAKYGPPKKKLLKKSKIPSYAIPEDRNTRCLQSVVDTSAPSMVLKRSPMDPRELAKESLEVQEATIAKSNSLAPMYNKGALQFLTPGIDVTTIGSRSRRP